MQNAIRIFDFNLKERVSGIWDENIPIIRHAVVECVGVERNFLIKNNLVKILLEITQDLDLCVVDTYTHNFIPQGNTVIFVLEESHFAVHSWPERGYFILI